VGERDPGGRWEVLIELSFVVQSLVYVCACEESNLGLTFAVDLVCRRRLEEAIIEDAITTQSISQQAAVQRIGLKGDPAFNGNVSITSTCIGKGAF
jgi:hypothetical protein